MGYNLRNIHQLLNAIFNEQELRDFCFLENDFRPVHEQLRDTDRKSQILNLLLDHAARRNLMAPVLAWAKGQNAEKYQQYQPYEVVNPPPSPVDTPLPDVAPSGEYHSCFISYASADEAFAEQLHADLIQAGVACWFAPEDLKIGDKIRATLDRSIQTHDKLLLILSQNSIASNWVEKEAETAFELERRQGTLLLFPIRLDDTVMDTEQAWAADIRRTRLMGDFRRWAEPTAYQKALKRLLRDLKLAV